MERIRELEHAGREGIRAARGLVEIAEAERDQWRRRAERVEAAAREAVEAYVVVEDWLVIDTELAGGSHLADGARFINSMRGLVAELEPKP